MSLTLLDALGGKHGWADLYPPVDIREAILHYEIDVDLRGLEVDDVEVEVVGTRLMLRFANLERVIELPEGVDPDRVSHGIEDDILRVVVPKPDEMVRRVSITGTRSS